MAKRKNVHFSSCSSTPNKLLCSETSTTTPQRSRSDPISTSAIHGCTQCPKVFPQLRGLTRHVREVHDREATFPCRQGDCAQLFVRREYRNRHESTHTRQGYSQCPGCPLTCREDYLEQHLQSSKGALCRAIREQRLNGPEREESKVEEVWLQRTFLHEERHEHQVPHHQSTAPDHDGEDAVSARILATDAGQHQSTECNELEATASDHPAFQLPSEQVLSQCSMLLTTEILGNIGHQFEAALARQLEAPNDYIGPNPELIATGTGDNDPYYPGSPCVNLQQAVSRDDPKSLPHIGRLEKQGSTIVRTFAVRSATEAQDHHRMGTRRTNASFLGNSTSEHEILVSVAVETSNDTPMGGVSHTMEMSPDKFSLFGTGRDGETSIEQAMRTYESLDDFDENDGILYHMRQQRTRHDARAKGTNPREYTALTCKLCGKPSKTARGAILAHAQEHHRSHPPLMHACKICGLKFMFKSDYDLHARKPGKFRTINECYPSVAYDQDDFVAMAIKDDLGMFRRQLRLWENLQLQQYFRALMIAFTDVKDHGVQQRPYVSLPAASNGRRSDAGGAATVIASDYGDRWPGEDAWLVSMTDNIGEIVFEDERVAKLALPLRPKYERLRA